MSTSKPSVKRRRPSEESENDIQEPAKITKSEYWFEDGNIIIQAENTRFRVHRSVLSRNSTVFKDMFRIPQPQRPDAVFDSCPIVHLSDKAQDVGHIMSIFYDTIRIHDMRVPMPFDDFEAILRLGKKYDIQYLLEEGLQRFHAEFPDTLSKWELTPHASQQVDADPIFHERAMALAYELSINTVLPAICLWFIQSKSVGEILEALEEVSPVYETLRFVPHLLKACLEGRDKILCKVENTFIDWIRNGLASPIAGSKCSNAVKCSFKKAEVITSLSAFSDFTNIAVMDDVGLPAEIDQKICKGCRGTLEEAIQTFREETWNELPSLFKIGDSWDALEDF